MSHYRRANTAGATYFFTVVTYRRRQFLCDEDVREPCRVGHLRPTRCNSITYHFRVGLKPHPTKTINPRCPHFGYKASS